MLQLLVCLQRSNIVRNPLLTLFQAGEINIKRPKPLWSYIILLQYCPFLNLFSLVWTMIGRRDMIKEILHVTLKKVAL